MTETGAIVYRGPSMLTGDPILAVLTGLDGGSLNPKTGSMAQAFVIRSDEKPMDAIRADRDDAVCGDCALRGRGGLDRQCYTVPWFSATTVFKHRDDYLEPCWSDLQALVEGRQLRLCAYGDMAAVPFEIWKMLLVTASGHTAYTHSWRRCDQRFKTIAMASVDSEHEFLTAQLGGWRTFRIRGETDPLMAGSEFVCPASDEGDHRTTCERCQLCRGTSSQARSVAIVAHGHNGALTAFYRSRRAAEVAVV